MDPKNREEVRFENEMELKVWMETMEQNELGGGEILENS